MDTITSFRYKHYLRVIKRLKENKILPLFTFENYVGVKKIYNLKCACCNFEFVSSFDNGKNPKCPKCLPNRFTINFGHPLEINIKCDYCNKRFNVLWKNRYQRFCSTFCKNEFIKKDKRETVVCLTCGNLFERYKNILHPDTGKPTQYCSNGCSARSMEKKNRLRKWIVNNNPMNNLKLVDKIKQTKLEKYGDENYNNLEKTKQTMINKYGVSCAFYIPTCKSNGKRISKFQRREYEKILKQYPDAKLELYLPDVQKSVDIFIPSIKKVVECYGDYWHCNPLCCLPDYYNNLVHLTAQEIWKRDENRITILKNAGYDVEIIWENSNKRFKS